MTGMTELHVRDARPDDRPAIDALAGRFMPTADAGRDLTAADADAGRAPQDPPGTRTVVAVGADDVPVGYLTVRPEAKYFTGVERAYIERLAVDDRAEGGGVERLLMAWAKAWATERGYRHIALDVFAQNARARRFYVRSGFDDDFIRMVAPLAPEDSDEPDRPE